MNKAKIIFAILFVTLTLVTIAGYAKTGVFSSVPAKSADSSAAIWTDKADYQPGETVTIYGAGFLPNTNIAINVTKAADGTVTSWNTVSDANGNFSTTYQIGSVGAPLYTVTASDGTNTATTTFADASITLDPASGDVGSSVTVSGSGFADNSAITATFGGSSVPLTGTTTTDSSGSFSDATFTVPLSNWGSQTVTITDGSLNSASANYTVNSVSQSITVTMSNSAPSATVTINGGYPSPTTFTADGDLHTITMSANSSFTLSFTNTDQTRDGFSVPGFSTTSSAYNASTAPVTPTAYEQVQNTFSSTFNGGDPGGTDSLTLTGTYLGTGSSTIVTLSSSNSWSALAWSDYNTAVTFPASTVLSGASERWSIGSAYSTAALMTGGNIYSETYYHQYSITFGYSDQDSSAITSGTEIGSYYKFGSSTAGTINSGTSYGTTSPVSDWVDAGSGKVSYQTFISATQRWALSTSPVAMNVASSTTLSELSYYHQFSVSFAYSTNDGSTLKSQSDLVSYTQFGGTLHLSTNSAGALSLSSDWADAATSVTYVSPVTISGSERYMIASGDSGTHTVIASVASGASANPEYYHQYTIVFGYGDQDGSVVTSGSQIGSYYQFGSSLPIAAGSSYGSTSPGSDWVNAGSNMVSYQTFTSGGQRWALQSSPVTFTVSSSTTIFDSSFYHQYSITFGYGDQDSSAITSGIEIGSYYKFGSSTAGTINSGTSYGTTSPVSDWVDAGSGKVSYQTFISATQRWALSTSPVAMNVASSTTLSEPSYYHQFSDTLSYSVSGGGSPSAPTFTADQFGSSAPQTLPTTATSYWYDAGASWTVSPNPLGGSGSSERWETNQATSGTLSSTAVTTVALTYYNQFFETFQYSIANSPAGSPSSGPSVTFNQFGSPKSSDTAVLSPSTSSSDWVDASSSSTAISYANPLGVSTSSERWQASSTPTFAATSSTSFDPSYYHQYTITFGYGDQDSSVITSGSQIGSYYEFGSSSNTILAGASYDTSSPSSAWVDAGTNMVSYQTYTSGTQRWALSSSPATFTVSSSTTISDTNFYHQYQVTASYSTSDSSTPSANVVLSGTQFNSALPTTNLGTTAQNVWLDAGTAWSVNNPITSGTQRWDAATSVSGTVSSVVTIAPLYYHQYQQTLSYIVVDGGSPTAPTASGLSLGSAYAPTLTASANSYWFDASGSITFSTSTSGSTERWSPSPASISATSVNTVVVNMYNQYEQTLSYSVVDGGSPTAPTATGTSLGSAYAPSLTTTGTGYWFDASGSITISTPTSGSTEQWAPSPGSISATSASTQVVIMYNQYKQTLSYTVLDGGSPSAPTASGLSLGSAYAPTLTATATGYWFDASGSITISTPTSGSTERWSPNPASISATLANTQVVSMYNQYEQTLSYQVVDGGSPTAPTATGTSLGVAYAPSLTTTATGYWFDAGSSWSVTNPLGGSSGTERWYTSQAVGGTVSATTITFTYYNQYSITFQYSESGGGSGYSSPPVTYTQFGTSGNTVIAVTSGGTAIWVDAGTTYSYTNPLAESGSSEQWATSTATGTASASATVSKTYYNQYNFTLNYEVSGGGSSYSAPTLNGTEFGSAYAPTLTGTATAYWLDSGSSWSVTNPLLGSSTIERWDTSQISSGTVSAAQTTLFTYYNQYQVTFAVNPSGTGSTSPAGVNVWENAGSLSITATPNTSYSFSSWSSTAGTVANTTSASTSITISGSGTITANFLPTALNHFVFETIGSQVAGAPFTITITAVDASGNTVTIYNGTPTLSYSAGSISPSSATGGFSNGVWTGSVTVTVAGADVTLGVADGPITGTSNTFAVTPAALDHITISPLGAGIVAGGSKAYSAEGFDQYGNDLGAVTAAYSVNGVGITGNSVSETLVGSYTVTATYNGKTASTTLTVTAAALNYITISPSSATITAGNSQSYTATAYDKYGNSLGTVLATYSVHGASVSGNTVSATAAGSYIVTATYNGLTSNAATLAVNPGSLNHFVINVPASATAGSSFSITITAMDAYGNTVTNFTGTVSLSVNHGSISPSTSGSFIAGTWVGSVTLNHAGSVAITVNGGNGHGITSNAIAVSPISSTLIIIIVAVVIVIVIVVISIILVRRGSTKNIIILPPKGSNENQNLHLRARVILTV